MPKPKPGEEAEEEEEDKEEETEEETEEEEAEETPPPAPKAKKSGVGRRKLLDAADELRGVAKDLRADMQAMKKGGILGKLVGGKEGTGDGSEDPAKGGSGREGEGKKKEGGFADGLLSFFGLD